MADLNYNIRRIQAVDRPSAESEITPKMLVHETAGSSLGFMTSVGDMVWYPAEGSDASFNSVTDEELAGPGDRNIGVNVDGKIIELPFPDELTVENITVSQTAESGVIYLVDTTAGEVTLTLPNPLQAGFNTRVYKQSSVTSPKVIVNGNGTNIGSTPTQEIVGQSEGISIISDDKYYIIQDNRGALQRKLSQSTGILSGFNVTVNVDPTKIDISSGVYVIEDATDMLNPTSNIIQYDGVVGYPITSLATQGLTFVLIDVNGVLSQQTNTSVTPTQWRNQARFVTVQHFFGTGNIESVVDYQTPPQNPASRLSAYMNTIGIVRDGIIISGASLNNLQIAHTSGSIISPGSNQETDSLDPDNVGIGAFDPITQIVYLVQNNVERVDSVIDVLNYDLNGVITLIAGNSTTCTIHRVFMGIDGTVAVQYGQNIYATLTDARTALFNGEDVFVENPILNDITTLLGYIIATKSAINLNDESDALFFATDRFGSGGTISAGGAGSTTLQEAYNNSLSDPEIITNVTRKALDIRSGSGDDGDSVFTVQNTAGDHVIDITGEHAYIGEQEGQFLVVGGETAGTTGKVQINVVGANGSDLVVTGSADGSDGAYVKEATLDQYGFAWYTRSTPSLKYITVDASPSHPYWCIDVVINPNFFDGDYVLLSANPDGIYANPLDPNDTCIVSTSTGTTSTALFTNGDMVLTDGNINLNGGVGKGISINNNQALIGWGKNASGDEFLGFNVAESGGTSQVAFSFAADFTPRWVIPSSGSGNATQGYRSILFGGYIVGSENSTNDTNVGNSTLFDATYIDCNTGTTGNDAKPDMGIGGALQVIDGVLVGGAQASGNRVLLNDSSVVIDNGTDTFTFDLNTSGGEIYTTGVMKVGAEDSFDIYVGGVRRFIYTDQQIVQLFEKSLATLLDNEIPTYGQVKENARFIVYTSLVTTGASTLYPDYNNGDYQSGLQQSGNIILGNPTNMVTGDTLVLEISSTSAYSVKRVTTNEELIAVADDGIYTITILCTGASTFRFSYGAEVVV